MLGKLARWVLVFSVLLPLFAVQPAAAQTTPPEVVAPLLISEVQTGDLESGIENARQEFIELQSQTPDVLDVTGWKVQYFAGTRTDVADGMAIPSSGREFMLDGEIEPYGLILLSSKDYITEADGYLETTAATGWLAMGGGHIRIIDTNHQVVDRVGWGTAAQPETKATAEIPSGMSMQRYLNCETDLPIDTNDNSHDFVVNQSPNPGVLGESYINQCDADGNPLPPEPPIEPCEGIELSEILSNATGVDDGKEFIEIHNPTGEALPLLGCALRLGEGGKEFELPNQLLEPGAYRAFYDSETGITLPNTAGGTVWLLLTSDERKVPYPELKDDQTWALFGGPWKATLKPTPGAANQLVLPKPEPEPVDRDDDSGLKPCAVNQERNPETNRCRLISSDQPSFTSCNEGQERNPATNRCRSVLSASNSLTPCKPGQERNLSTNRCRSIVSVASSLTPCKPGQTRNPATNRCRSTASATTAYKPCAPNQERNPETNRCRLAASAGNTLGIAEVKDVATGPVASNPRWWLAGAAVLGAIGYGAYEWRQEIKGLFGRLKQRSSSGAAPK